MNNKEKDIIKIYRALTWKSLLIMFGVYIFYAAAGIILFFLAYALYSRTVWFEYDLIYRLAQLVEEWLDYIAILYFIGGFLAILFYFWRKPYRYLADMIAATESIYQMDDTLIEFTGDLKVVESRMNQIKVSVQKNQRAAKEAEQRKNDLVVYLAHDLKTPLTSVIGYLTLLRDEQQISPELREKYLSVALEKAERLEDLINEFFEITRFNLTHLTLEVSKVNLTRMMEQLVYEFNPIMAEKNLNCQLSIEKDVTIRCDVDKMQRVLDNLLRNAVNYSFENTDISITVEQNEKKINIQVKNHGNTIPEEKRNRIFEQFFRLDSARTSKSGGAGLGLAIAKEIVELHQGSIGVESYDEIIIFTVVLPVL